MRYYIMSLEKYVDMVYDALDCIPKGQKAGFSVEDYYYESYRESLMNEFGD